MIKSVPKIELDERMNRFIELMKLKQPDFRMAIITSKVNMYYFTGTMQDGILIISTDYKPILWVRRSYNRAVIESDFENIKPMNSYSHAASFYAVVPDEVYLEANLITFATYNRIKKSFRFLNLLPVDTYISYLRSKKSEYELQFMRKSGEIHRRILDDIVPNLLVEGISETQFIANLYPKMVDVGYQGISRFSMQDIDTFFGQISFGSNSAYPAYFNGPGGERGQSAVIPILGDKSRLLTKGDLIFVDIAMGYEGYHTDCTKTYVFGGRLPDYAIDYHLECKRIQKEISDKLKPGAIPADIYKDVYSAIDSEFAKSFMGVQPVGFLGHGIGLTVDEMPIIAPRFIKPLECNMTLAIEPKRAIEGIGTVGVEDTFIVTKSGGVSITGDDKGLQII